MTDAYIIDARASIFENVFLACTSLKDRHNSRKPQIHSKDIFMSNYVNETTNMVLVFENCREDDMQNYRLKFVDCAFSRKKFNV